MHRQTSENTAMTPKYANSQPHVGNIDYGNTMDRYLVRGTHTKHSNHCRQSRQRKQILSSATDEEILCRHTFRSQPLGISVAVIARDKTTEALKLVLKWVM